MKLIKFQVDQLRVPLVKPYVLSKEYGTMPDTGVIVLRAYTDEGIVGYGECDPWPLFTGDSSEICTMILRDYICPRLIGCDPTNIQEIHRIMDGVIRNQTLTKSAVDMAMYDILGKSVGLPVHKLLGGKVRDKMDVMWAIGGSTPEESAAEILKVKEQGYKGCMIKIGGEDWRLDAARTIAAREAVGPDFQLNADANQGWDADTAIRYGKAVKDCDLMFFEQPVQSWDIDGLAKIRRNVSMPVSADESLVSVHDALRMIQAEAVDYFSIKITKHGGIYPAQEICKLAKAHGVGLFFNSMLEEGITQAASLAVGATMTNIVPMGHAYFSVQRLKKDITDFHTRLGTNGLVDILDRPGLGVSLNEEVMAEFTETSCTIV